MSDNDDFLHGAGLGNVLPSTERRAMTKDRSLAESEEPKRAPIQYVEKVPAAAPAPAAARPADDDPFGIFGAAPAPAPAPASVFGFSNAPAAAAPRAAQPAPSLSSSQDDPFAAFGPAPVPAPAPAPAPAADAFDPFSGFAPTQPAAAPAPAAATADNGWGFPEDDFFCPPPASKPDGASTSADNAATDAVPDMGSLDIKDKPPPLPTEGTVLTRLSARSLFAKDWAESYWVFRGYHMYIYRNQDDFKYSAQGENIKKDITITAKMRCLPIKKKEYSGFGQLHNFFLEEVEDYGANQIAKFASRNLKDLEVVYNQINRRIRKLRGV